MKGDGDSVLNCSNCCLPPFSPHRHSPGNSTDCRGRTIGAACPLPLIWYRLARARSVPVDSFTVSWRPLAQRGSLCHQPPPPSLVASTLKPNSRSNCKPIERRTGTNCQTCAIVARHRQGARICVNRSQLVFPIALLASSTLGTALFLF